MPATTPRLALPYPVPDDSVDVPRDVLALATKLDGITGITPVVVATLPAAPVEGQECVWSPVMTPKNTGVTYSTPYWRMRYVSGRWRYLGGTPYIVRIPGSFSLPSPLAGSFLPLKTRVNIPAIGDWSITGHVALTPSSGSTAPVSVYTLVMGVSDNAGGASGWTEVQTSAAIIGSISAAYGSALFGVTTLTSPNFESWITAFGNSIYGTVNFGSMRIEPVAI